LLRCSVVCSQGKKTKTTEKTKGNYQGNLLLLLLLLQQDCFWVLRFCVEAEAEVEEEEGEGAPGRGEKGICELSLLSLSLMENHQHRRLLNNSVKISDVKQQQQQSGWGSATANSLSNKLLNRSSGGGGGGNENRCSFGASLAAAAVGVHNPAPFVSRCSVECEEVEEEEEEEEEQEEKEKKAREVVVEEQGSSGLRSAWIQRIIPRVVGEEKEKERGLRESAEQDSLVGFWKKKRASCVVADVGSVRVVAQRAREPDSSNERVLDKQKEVQGGSGDGGDGVCSSSHLLGSRDELQRLGYQSSEDSAAAAAAAGGNRLLLQPEVVSSAAHVRSNAGGGGVVVAAGLGLQFDGGGGGAARNFWVANNNRSSSSNSSKERDMRNSCRFSTLPPLSPFVPFKHCKELHQSKSMDYQGNNSSSSGKLEEVAVAPLLTPSVLLPSYGVEQINAQQGKMAETVTWRMDNVPSLTPLYVPSKSSSLNSIDISRLREKGLLGLGEMLSRPTDLTQVFSPFKSPQDANDESPCSSKTASLPLELVLTMDPPNSNYSLKHEEDTGPKSRVQPEIDFEKCQQQAGSSANLCIAMPSPSSLWPGYENESGNQEPSRHSRGDVEIFRRGSSSGQCLVDHESQVIFVVLLGSSEGSRMSCSYTSFLLQGLSFSSKCKIVEGALVCCNVKCRSFIGWVLSLPSYSPHSLTLRCTLTLLTPCFAAFYPIPFLHFYSAGL
jgi:hypothetical protein